MPEGQLAAQAPAQKPERWAIVGRTGSWYASYGWNEDRYTDSDVRFFGSDHDFTLGDVEAHQRQKRFTVRELLNPLAITIPQFNLGIGYYIRDDLDVSIGMGHMKYVVRQGQTAAIDGYIRNADEAHDGTYAGASKRITRDWLEFEHTHGLNWFHVAVRKPQRLWHWRWVDLRAFESVGVGGLTPRTDATVLGRERHDKYRLAGCAIGASGSLILTLFRRFFLECEGKGGFFPVTGAHTSAERSRPRETSRFF